MDKSLEKQLALWLKSRKAACGPFLLLSVALGLFAGLLLIGQAWLLARMLSAVVMQGETIQALGAEIAEIGRAHV